MHLQLIIIVLREIQNQVFGVNLQNTMNRIIKHTGKLKISGASQILTEPPVMGLETQQKICLFTQKNTRWQDNPD